MPGDDGVHAGVAGAGDAVARLDEGLVAVEPEARALHEQVEAGDHGELDARGLRDAQLALPDRAPSRRGTTTIAVTRRQTMSTAETKPSSAL